MALLLLGGDDRRDPHSPDAAGSKTCFVWIDGCMVPRLCCDWHQGNPAAPCGVWQTFELVNILSPLEPFRDYVTIVSNTDMRNAEALKPPEIGGDHFRSSSVFLTQSHPKQSAEFGCLVGHLVRSAVRAEVGQDDADPLAATRDRERSKVRRL